MKQRNSLSALLAVAIAAIVTAGTALAATQPAPASDAGRATRPKLDVNNDGAIDRNEAAANPRLAAKFDQLDSNKDGKLDRSERPHRGGKGHGHGGMGGLIDADADGDGRISKTEAASMPWLTRDFDQIDHNRDGYVVRSELRSYHEKMRPQREAEEAKRAEERFAAADLNHDGKLSKLEVSEKMPQLSKGFAFIDEDRDGYLTRDDLRHSPRH
ncbi:calcium-binding protein [Lysobacter sp. S4-A87]|uniref:EF-hand domain-containing protein n=1 Tax=Lysobacter sp. S4-A87 TaxID=2925843 RepID=UPI001F53B6B4|nr:calcium-binding protein [Lysobacter sp. S4-A87]UNK50480.1 calcium-binding protein [Lysobacter sp. S4-A87]